MSSPRALALHDELRARGERITKARRAVLDVLADTDEHLTTEELLSAVNRAEPDVHRATVYRTVDRLAELGIVEHTHLGHGPAVYHLANDLHQHLVCESCGRITEVPMAILRGVERRLHDEYGFTMSPMHFSIVGRCQRCRDEAEHA
jgi:Fur family ferric uptake transcriptional regulator